MSSDLTKRTLKRRLLAEAAALTALVGVAGLGAAPAATTNYQTLYNFPATPTTDGSGPQGDLVMDASGNLYGTTQYGGAKGFGAVFELSPPTQSGGPWRETLLYSFRGSGSGAGDGAYPVAGLVWFWRNGNLWGVTSQGGPGNSGTVFELIPEGGGKWREHILYKFTGGADGGYPLGPVVRDSKGHLFGTTSNSYGTYGAVFELSPPSQAGAAWAFNVIHGFTNANGDGMSPQAGVIVQNGVVAGTTNMGGAYGHGIAYELTPPSQSGGPWTEKVLWSFGGYSGDVQNPSSNLIVDTLTGFKGRLYGTTTYGAVWGGGVFMLVPPGKTLPPTWKERVIHPFAAGSDGAFPTFGSVLMDASGNLYGMTAEYGGCGGGALYKLTRPASGSVWTSTVMHSFGCGSDGAKPMGGLIKDAKGNLYGMTSAGGLNGGGTVFELTP